MTDILAVLTQVGILVFVVSGMAAMGLGLTVRQVVGPLRDARLVTGVLVANFVVVPVVAVLAAQLLPMDDASAGAVILVGCCAGAPFLPTLARLAKGDQASAVGVMVLLMVVTVAFAPAVVPLVLEGATVTTWDIASSLVLYMLVPLALGLVVRARYGGLADHLVGPCGRASTAGLAIGIVAGLLVTWQDVVDSIGSWVFLGTALVLLAGLVAGRLAAVGSASADRTVLSLATAQRNVSAALVVAASLGTETVVRTLVAALVIPVVLIVLAGELGRRVGGDATEGSPGADVGSRGR